jgi:hypothetical protein
LHCPYFLPVNSKFYSVFVFIRVPFGVEDVKIVFREAFASLFGIGTTRVRRLCNLVREGKSPRELRGKHPNCRRSMDEEWQERIRYHIRKFPFKTCHYGPSGCKIRYLSEELSISKMYKLFLQEHFPEEYLRVQEGVKPGSIRCKVKYEYYRNFFNSHFGYRFARPRVDVCSTCEELRSELQNETAAERRKAHKERLKLHKLKAKIFHEERRE